MECRFCRSHDVELYDVDAPVIQLCGPCRDKLTTHIAVICVGCDTLFWLRKTPGNVMQASQMSDLPPEHIMDNYLIHEIKTCKRCYAAEKGFAAQSWVQ